MPKYNQQERLIPENIGNPRDKIYRNVLQDWISWDQKVTGQGKSELFTSFHRPDFRPKGKT